MHEFMKTIISAIKPWVSGEIKNASRAGVADWDQNDAEADNYVKNRTHWEEISLDTIIEEQTLTGFSEMENGIYSVVDVFTINPVVGQIYTVVWDGVSYDVPMEVITEIGLGYIGNVNYALMLPDGDIPFVIIFAGQIFVATTSQKPHTISVSIKKSTVHKLDDKYLPDGMQSDWNEIDETSKSFVLNRTHFDCRTKPLFYVGGYNVSYLHGRISDLFTLVADRVYTVEWDGVSYICTAKACQDGQIGLGNQSRLYHDAEDTGEPFYIEYMPDGWHRMLVEKIGRHSIEITEGYLQKLDSKYLPDMPDIDRGMVLTDKVSGLDHVIQIKDGNLVSFVKCDHIEIVQPPNKTSYMLGDKFDPTGMIVEKVMQDGKREVIDAYTYAPYITTYADNVIIKYEEDSIYSCQLDITVNEFDPTIALVDFDYTYIDNQILIPNGVTTTYILTGWKQTCNGVSSTELVIPDNLFVQL